jgi:hypothetical protein
MRRRDFLIVSFGAVALWPVSAHLQQMKMHRVAFVSAISPVSELIGANPINPFARAFLAVVARCLERQGGDRSDRLSRR